jgi:hypothetical protein
MKLKSLFAAVVVTLLLASCGKKPADILSKGVWKLSALETKAQIADSVKNAYLATATFEFKKDGSYSVSGPNSDAGTYTVDKDGKSLMLKSTAGKSDDNFTIVELTPEKVVLEDANGKFTVVPK